MAGLKSILQARKNWKISSRFHPVETEKKLP